MDTNGARALAKRLAERNVEPAEPTTPPAVSEAAAPIFHWFGVEPPESLLEHDERSAALGQIAG